MKKTIALAQLCLILTLALATSYLLAQNNYFENTPLQEEEYITKARSVIYNWLSKGMVSAQVFHTCLQDNNGSFCQEYSSDICNNVCSEECFPGGREDFSECKLGTCFDPSEGVCSANTPKFTCQAAGGQWTDANDGIPAQCTPGCCLLNGNAQFVTETTCNTIANRQGINIDGTNNKFDPNVPNELECIVLSEQQDEGACVLEEIIEEGKFNCEFLSKAECLGKNGDFHKDVLCSNEELNTICEKQASVSCVDGEDGLYWLDSCNNKENIYDSNRARSYNNGNVLALEDTCSLEQGNNPLANQERCGNCNYLLGSICGDPGEADDSIVDSDLGDFVCKDLSCTDEWGNHRQNGESWCGFDSQIGVDNENKENQRSVDVPGSRHYRRTCLDGEVRTDPCADYRGEICVENQEPKSKFSSASCRINLWQLCTEANTDEDKLDKCEENTDCVLHRIDIDEGFEFDVCTPRHPPGFNLRTQTGGETSEGICSLASQTCTVIEVKKISGWDCEFNCDCLEDDFAEEMNDLCISVGDCGGHVNIAGKFTHDGYKVTEDGDPGDRLENSYINQLRKYSEAQQNQFVKPLSGKEVAALFGVPESTFTDPNKFGEFLGKIGLGATGILVVAGLASKAFTISGLFAKGGATGLLGKTFTFQGTASVASFANLAGAAAAGAAIGFIVGKLFGLEGDGMLFAVIGGAIGAIAGILIGETLGAILIGGVIGALVFAGLALLLGLGDTREIEVAFSCMPWQPPAGGNDCDKCNNDPLGCSQYKCQSLGQTCALINEGTADELCYDIAPDDVTAPTIKPLKNAIGDGFQYTDVSNNGFKIETDSQDGCIKEFTPVPYGIELNEPGQCKVEKIHTDNYQEMQTFFGDSNLYRIEHETITVIPSLDSLGVPGSSADPSRRGDLQLFVRCQDSSGNANVKEHVISFCVAPADDLTPPAITEFVPASPGYVGLDVTEKNLEFFTNEPAECKWSLQDKPYDQMENPTVCQNNLEQVTTRGWRCNTVLDVTEQEEQEYYFRCIDKPWENDDANRNVNTQSTTYTLIKTTEALLISSISPDNETITVARDPVAVDLAITTAGGINGDAFCEFSLNQETFFDFFNTGQTTHTQSLSLFEGNHNIALRCTDDAENVATDNAVFTIEIDNDPPIVTNVYDLNGVLTVITNEPAECAYDVNTCGFNFENGTLFSGTDLVHTTALERGLTYRIKCQDNFGNTGGCFTAQGGY